MKNNKSKEKDKIETLEIKIKHLENQHALIKQQYEKTTEKYLQILYDVSKTNKQLQREITERKKAEEALKKAQDGLEMRIKKRTAELKKANMELQNEITDRKKTEEIIKESRKKFQQLYDEAPVGYHELDLKGTIVQVNKTEADLLGYNIHEMLGKSIFDFIAQEEREAAKEILLQKIEKLQPIAGFERKYMRKDGETIVFYIEDKLITDDMGKIICVRSTLQDTTDRKQLEEERMKIEKLESIGILAGGIAHDFNNILAAILGNISLVKISVDNKDEVVELLTEAEKACLRATSLTQQLLTFSKGGAPIKETTELTGLIRDTAKFSLRGSNVQYRTSISSYLWTVKIDKGQISQAINNLIINADQAMPEGGTIKIKAENISMKSEDNLSLKKGNYIKISIGDQGIGIPPEQLTKIFDPYFTTKQKGSGLGLTTTYSIIHRHNGHIAVESELGVGTTFHIYLPASSKEIVKKGANKEASAVITGKILVMDDEDMVRNVVSNALQTFGHEVEVVSDGEEAIKLYKKAMDSGKSFDVVIMDLTIPGGMGGKEAIKKLLEIDPDVKAVVSSGYSNDPVVSKYQEYGFSSFIQKPYGLEGLKKALKEVMSEKR